MNDRGYVAVNILGSSHKAHRIVWALYYGEEPKSVIDHVNGIRSDNRIENLRLADKSKNSANSKIRSDNTSGCKGVHYYKARKQWTAYVNYEGRRVNLGYFDLYEDAVLARLTAAKEVHGDFFRADM